MKLTTKTLGTKGFQAYYERLKSHNWYWALANTVDEYVKGKSNEERLRKTAESKGGAYELAFKLHEDRRDKGIKDIALEDGMVPKLALVSIREIEGVIIGKPLEEMAVGSDMTDRPPTVRFDKPKQERKVKPDADTRSVLSGKHKAPSFWRERRKGAV